MKAKAPVYIKVSSGLFSQTRPIGIPIFSWAPAAQGRFYAHLHAMCVTGESKVDFRRMIFSDFFPVRWIMGQEDLKVIWADTRHGFVQITLGFEANSPVFHSQKLDGSTVFLDGDVLVQH